LVASTSGGSNVASRRIASQITQDINALVQYMVENPYTIGRCLHLMVVSKSLERIADHATNVAEDVVYLCEAQDIRHTGVKSQAAPPTGA